MPQPVKTHVLEERRSQTTVHGESVIHHRPSTRRLPCNRDPSTITAKQADEALHPSKRKSLVQKSRVHDTASLDVRRGKEAQRAELYIVSMLSLNGSLSSITKSREKVRQMPSTRYGKAKDHTRY